jgi:hypothetical protein
LTALIATPALAAEEDLEATPRALAVLQGLDKITARISTFDATIDQPIGFGSLEVVVRACYRAPPELPPESTAFIEVVDVRPDSPPVQVFSGWMFASSPAVSAMEHAVYDIRVLECRDPRPESAEAAEE